ncbi:hypothetical protein [Paenibacillus lutimineralis]|uniref:Uncharacterized protein n=1 Tax=Paenibacillus lutimineralis TaxID=2707005 RepID=A0A3S9UVB8_9BACL|nr:hypothetical protein [Paenibacillus lutimineralis]AZS14246.1 hypothetical protein EI981_07080 [Paenibacillus lutimineralis]
MRKKFEYKTLQEREALMKEHADWYFVEEHNLIDGNFLIFTDTIEEPLTYISIPKAEYYAMKQSDIEIKQAIAELTKLIASS